jgi:pimeloyl-ACP methyl ester carboxylesterase/predicted glycosyltransferase
VRARAPDVAGHIDRDGVRIGYEVYGDGDPTLLLIPPAPITHSRIWKAQIPHLARDHRVVTFDGRGNGRSGRPTTVDAHTRAANVADIAAVLDATRTAQAVLVAHCHANWWAVETITAHPERVLALVAIAPGVPYLGTPQPHWVEAARTWDDIPRDPTGWQLCNRHSIVHDHRRWIDFFFDAQLVEAHSTKQYEDAVSWALESTGEVLAASEEAQDLDPPPRVRFEQLCRDLDVPTLVIHGAQDVCQHVDRGRAFADLTGGQFLVVEGAGHLLLVRDPVVVNRAITAFVSTGAPTDRWRSRAAPRSGAVAAGSATRSDRTADAVTHRQIWSRALHRDRKVLYLSSPIGLGHARRDLAIAEQLRTQHPDVQIDWLAQHPVTDVLLAAGETVHPASAWLASESAHMASEAAGHDLHCFQALRRMDEILVANFMLFQEVVEDGLYDLVVGDEAWDVDHFWHENPELKRGSHVWLTDFVGYLPMPDGGPHEADLTADYNAEMIEQIDRFPRVRDRAIFVGNPTDVVPDVFGPGLPAIGDWTRDHFDFSGYITGFTPPTPDQVEQWRAELGYGPGEQVCLVTVGGSGVGRALLEMAIAAFPIARRAVPGLRMVVVAGPRIDPAQLLGRGPAERAVEPGAANLPPPAGLQVTGYVPDLHRHLSVCDLAIVQGGLTTTMELTAARRPFLYFPLGHHFEQTYHVRHRLDQYGAGTCMDYGTTDPDALAAAIAAEIGRDVDVRPVETGGAGRAAAMIADLLS